jgi:hypothetical protein
VNPPSRSGPLEAITAIPSKGLTPVQPPATSPAVSVCGLAVFESRQAAGLADQLTDSYSRFYLVVSGHARWESGSRRYLLGPDTLCHIPPGCPPARRPCRTIR